MANFPYEARLQGIMLVLFSKSNIKSKIMTRLIMIHYHYYYYFLIFVFHFPLLFRETQSRAIASKHSYSVGTNALRKEGKAAWCIVILTGIILLFACYNKLFCGTGGNIIGKNQQVRGLGQSAAALLFTHKTNQVRLLNAWHYKTKQTSTCVLFYRNLCWRKRRISDCLKSTQKYQGGTWEHLENCHEIVMH